MYERSAFFCPKSQGIWHTWQKQYQYAMKSKLSLTIACCLLFLAGCGGEKSASEQTTITPLPTLSASPSSTVFKRKELPVLGGSIGQMSDETEVLNIITLGKSDDEIPQTSSAGIKPNPIAVKLGHPPKGTDVCNLPYSALIRAMYEKCFSQGMSPTDVANIVGWEGKEVASTGSTKTYEWDNGRNGSMVIVFEGDRLASKSQTGLKP